MDKRVTISGLPETPREFGFWMDGGWQGARTLYERISPAHGVPVTRIPVCTVDDLNAAVAAARRAFEDRSWAGLSGADRAGVLLRAADILRQRRDEIAYWEVLENGKPIAQARGEIDQTRQHVAALGVDHAARREVLGFAVDGDDAARSNRDVADLVETRGRIDDAAVLNE